MAFKYRGDDRSVEEVVRTAKSIGGAYDSFLTEGIPSFRAKEGENVVRILPRSWDDDKKWGRGWHIEILVHYQVGPDRGTYLCREKMLGEPCPVCDARRESEDQEEIDQLRPGARGLCWVIDRNNEKAGPQVWSMPATKVLRELINRQVDRKTGAVVKIDNPSEGYDISFMREGTDKRSSYTNIEIDREATSVHEDEKKQKRWLDYIEDNSLPDVLNFYEYDYIEKVLSGTTTRAKEKEEEPVEEEDRRSRRTREAEAEAEEAPRSTRRARPEPAEEEEEAPFEEESAADESAEEEEAPASRRRARNGGGEDEEAEQKAPARGRRGARPTPEEEEAPAPARTARRSLEKLKGRRANR